MEDNNAVQSEYKRNNGEIGEEEGYLIIGGDFNARTGNEGGPTGMGRRKEEEIRKSRDKIINGEGRILINKIRERGQL